MEMQASTPNKHKNELKCKIEEAQQTGILHICGEMQLPFNSTVRQAFKVMSPIASDCGYLVSMEGNSRISVCGGDIIGYYVLEWFNPENTQVQKIEHWTSEWAYSF